MKRYVKATTLTTEQVAEEFKKTGYFYGCYTTRRGKNMIFLLQKTEGLKPENNILIRSPLAVIVLERNIYIKFLKRCKITL